MTKLRSCFVLFRQPCHPGFLVSNEGGSYLYGTQVEISYDHVITRSNVGILQPRSHLSGAGMRLERGRSHRGSNETREAFRSET